MMNKFLTDEVVTCEKRDVVLQEGAENFIERSCKQRRIFKEKNYK